MKRTAEYFGEINLYQLLNINNGILKVQLIDAGMIRNKEQSYEFGYVENDDSLIWIKPKGPRSPRKIIIPAIIPITPKLLIFFGMYDGDGNKTGNIGFAQNNTELQTFVGEGIEKVFPAVFVSKVNILESTKFFEADNIKKEVLQFKKHLEHETKGEVSILEAQKFFLLEEFRRMDFKIGKEEEITITISPKKGGETKGKRSYEIIIEKKNSRYYLILLLFLIKETINAMLGIKHTPAICWGLDPQGEGNYYLDTELFIQSKRCQYPRSRGISGYSINAITDDYIEIYRKSKANSVKIYKQILISPLLYVMFGIYWAEGTTTKKKLFSFREQKETGLNIGFNSSEDISLRLFFNSIFKIFHDPAELISCWLVKIGAKYHAESSALGSKLAVPVTRGGPGGDGIARTVEITKCARDWAISQFPTMKDWIEYYGHVEFTGAGIPRIDIRCKPTGALFFFSLMTDLTFYEDAIEPFIKKQEK